MASTVIRGAQIKDSTVQRHDLDTSTVGQAVVTKLVQGSGVTLSSTGADSGTGDVTVSTSAIPLASSSTSGLMNQTSGNTTDFIDGTNNSQPLQPVIWSVRLRSLNVLGNPTFEVDQKLCGGTVTASGTFSGPIIDRWYCYKAGTGVGYCAQVGTSNIVLPGTNFVLTTHGLLFNTTTTQASLAATDTLRLAQQIEGSQMRELIGDVHSLQLLVSSTVTPLKFSVCLRDNPVTKSIVYLCTYNAAANTSQLITIPNIPVWASGGNWSTQPGNLGYILEVTLACGSTYLTSPGAWASGTFLGATGMDNFLANAVNSQFVLRFVQNEPGALCSTPIDCPLGENLDGNMGCMRYFQKSYDLGTKPGTVTTNGSMTSQAPANLHPMAPCPFPKRMAKVPTMTAYSTATGAANNVRDNNSGIDRAISSAANVGESGFGGFIVTTPNTAATIYYAQWTADTGW